MVSLDRSLCDLSSLRSTVGDSLHEKEIMQLEYGTFSNTKYTMSLMGHFTFWISLPLSGNITYTHRPQGVNYREYLHVLKYLLFIIIILQEKGIMQTKSCRLLTATINETIAIRHLQNCRSIHTALIQQQLQRVVWSITNLTPRPTAGCCHLANLMAWS